MLSSKSIFVWSLAISIIAACGAPKDAPSSAIDKQEEAVAEPPQNSILSLYDTSLHRFSEPFLSVDRHEGESMAAFSLRELDVQLGKFRDRGIEYQNSNGTDEVFFEWLAATSTAPPAYAIDRFEWASSQFDLKPNTVRRADNRKDEWESQMGTIIFEALGSGDVSEPIARQVLSGSLRQALLSERERHARTGEPPDFHSLEQDLMFFLRAFDGPISQPTGSGEEAYLWSINAFLSIALGRSDVFDLDNSAKIAFANEMARLDSSGAKFFANDMIAKDGNFDFHPFYGIHLEFERRILDEFGGFTEWYSTSADGLADVAGIFYSTPTYPSMHQSQTPIERTANSYEHYTGSIILLEKIRIAWPNLSDAQRFDVFRLSNFLGGPAFFPLNSAAFVFGLVDDQSNLDVEELTYWMNVLRTQVDDMRSSDTLSTSDKVGVEVLWGRRLMHAARLVEGLNEGQLDLQLELELRETISQAMRLLGDAPDRGSLVAGLISQYYIKADDFGTLPIDVRAFVAGLPSSVSQDVDQVVQSMLAPVELRPGVEVSIQARTLGGDVFDTNDVRGSIVLIDHWDTNCGPCIAAMPVLHEVYERYKERGVEVVSIAYDGTSQRPRVERIKEESELTWITLDGEGLWPAIAARYGYRGVPQYMLLDREGRWYAGTKEMGNGANFEALLKEMLAAEEAEIIH